ncbi:MAG: hypothetical protein M0Q29_09335 [Thiopseudomonas sp.]|nr:hypothetical protein [Thiopseudomonas sp.]
MYIEDPSQIFWHEDELYRAGDVLVLPYTTTGDWGVEESLFVAVGASVLRQDLANPDMGAALVARSVIVVNSVSEMIGLPGIKVGQNVRTLGYYEQGDGGGNDYEIVAVSTGVDDGGSHIDLSGSGLQARGLFASETVSSQQWGTSKKVFYVSTDGRQGANGGIDDPFDSLQSCYDYISSLGQWFVGSFEIRLGSGTYSTPGGRVVNNARFENQLVIKGAAVGGHPNVPTTVITLPGGNHGFSPGFKNWLKIEDIKCTGNTANGEAFSVGNGCVLSLVNCHTQGVRLPVTYQHGAQLGIAGGVYDGDNIASSYGVRGYYGSSHSITAPDIASGAIFKNFTYGLYINEGCFGHLDHTTVTDCETGVYFGRVDSGSNTKGMRIHRCGVGVRAYCSSWMDNGIDFGIGTADKCTVPVDSRASAEFYERASRNISRTPRYQSSGMWGLSQTNTVDDVTIWTPGEIRPGYARATGDVITIKLIVVPNAANSGNSVVSFRINGVYAGGVQVGPTDGRGVVEAHMLFGTSTEIRSLVTFTSPNANRSDYKTLAVPDSGDITVHLSNASLEDTFSINFGTYETTLGG